MRNHHTVHITLRFGEGKPVALLLAARTLPAHVVPATRTAPTPANAHLPRTLLAPSFLRHPHVPRHREPAPDERYPPPHGARYPRVSRTHTCPHPRAPYARRSSPAPARRRPPPQAPAPARFFFPGARTTPDPDLRTRSVPRAPAPPAPPAIVYPPLTHLRNAPSSCCGFCCAFSPSCGVNQIRLLPSALLLRRDGARPPGRSAYQRSARAEREVFLSHPAFRPGGPWR